MFYTLTNTMCYHSNKLNVHYLHDIGSQGPQVTPSRRGKEGKSPPRGGGASGPSCTPRAKRSHGTAASPGRVWKGSVGAHAKERQGGTDPAQRKCHRIKDNSVEVPAFPPNTLSPGLVRHRAEPLPQHLSLGRAPRPWPCWGLSPSFPRGPGPAKSGGMWVWAKGS